MKKFSSIKLAMGALALAILLPACATGEMDQAEIKASAAPVSMVLRDLDGQQHDLNKVMRGGVPVALVFWQSW